MFSGHAFVEMHSLPARAESCQSLTSGNNYAVNFGVDQDGESIGYAS